MENEKNDFKTAHDKLITGMGTRVFRRPDGLIVVVGATLDYEPGPGEQLLPFVRDVVVHYPLADPVTARIEFLTNQGALQVAIPEFVYKHPITGKVNQIKRVEFSDGSVWLNPDYIDEEAAKGVQEIIEKFKECQAGSQEQPAPGGETNEP
ncbi:MAG: hypothetical protein WC322_06310 [Candidatus Paceibacterota bacterium]|jgi:hypothetical protein